MHSPLPRCLAKTWTADRYRQARHDKSSRPSHAHRTRRPPSTPCSRSDPISAAVPSANRWKGEGIPVSTRDQFTAPDAVAPMGADSFRCATARPPRQVAADPSSASINVALGNCSLADSLRKIAATRAALRHTLRRPGERLWLLLHALSVLDGPASIAQAIGLPEDDYRRLAARQQETHARCTQGTAPPGAMNTRPLQEQRQRHHPDEK